MAQHTIELPCIKDTWIDESNPNTSHGTDSILIGGYFSDGDNVYALLAFDWSSLPARKKITGIKLKFYNVNSLELGGASRCRFEIGYIKETWDESTTWRAPYRFIGGSSIYLENVNIPGSQYYEITLSLSDVMYQNIVNNGIHVIWYKMIDSQVQPSYVTMHSRENTYPPLLVVTYEDVPPSAPTPTDPIGVYKDNKSIIHFAWTYNSDVGGEQKAFDLQWSTDQTNWTTVSQTTANNYYDMPADTLPAGNIYWRVRTYNEYDEVGPYCDIQSFYAIGAPAAPVINAIPTNTARPVVSWSAFNQQVYQLQVLSGDTVVYDSGIVPGISIRQHKVKAWLADGAYTVRLRIKNEYDLWSEWSSATVTISTVKPAKPTVTAEKTTTGIKLTISGASGRMLIYRDGVCIGETSTGEYFDNAVANGKEYSYIARAVEGYPERQITNLLGSDGDCESISSRFAVWQSSLSLDTENKVLGSKCIKITLTASLGDLKTHILNITDNSKYYLISAYMKNGETTRIQMILEQNGTVAEALSTLSFYGTTMVRHGVKVKPANIGVGSTYRYITLRGNGASGNTFFVDGIILNEITEDEYNNLTVDQLMAKYPFGNNTFMAPAIETFTDSDPVTATAEFSHALIAPVSDLSDVFTFSRSLNTPPKRTYNLQPGGAFVEYAGRKHPVWEPTEHVSAAWAMAFFLKSWNDVEAFIALVDRKETVLYRDARGRKIYGVLGNLTVNDEISGYTVGFTLTEVDHIEEVEV